MISKLFSLIRLSMNLGKTYACYYAMEQVLKEKDRICVYVAPTKALVNQVAGRGSLCLIFYDELNPISSYDLFQVWP